MNIVMAAGVDALIEGLAHELQLRLAHDVAEEARDRAPRRTGRLAASIGVADEGDTVVVQATAPYAAYVELGTRKMRAEPYLMPALTHERSG